MCPRGAPILPHVPHKAEQGCWCCSSLCALSSSLCSQKVAAAIPPSPVPVAPFLPSCGALIDARPSTRPTNKHLYPLLFVPTPPAHRAAGKRVSFWCQTSPAQLMPADFGAAWCQRLLQLIFFLPGFPPHWTTSWGGSIDLRSAQQSIWSSE